MSFSVLYVCTGNICRSPFAETLTRHLLAQRGADSWCTVASAGVAAVVGSGMHPHTRGELGGWNLAGEPAERFRARQVDRFMLAAADLVLTASPEHRAAVVRLEPAALATAFGVLEFARLARSVDLAGLPAEPVYRARRLVAMARARRGMTPPPPASADTIPDPIAGPDLAHARSARICAAAVAEIVDRLASGGPVVPGPRTQTSQVELI
ncbi:MAG: arsenate-mycothiol transferase ArsC [Sporichthyaceae bacterium]